MLGLTLILGHFGILGVSLVHGLVRGWLVSLWRISGWLVVSFMKALASIASVISGLFVGRRQEDYVARVSDRGELLNRGLWLRS